MQNSKKLPQSGCQLGAYLIENATPFEVESTAEAEKRSQRGGRHSGRAAFGKQKDKSKSEHRRYSNR